MAESSIVPYMDLIFFVVAAARLYSAIFALTFMSNRFSQEKFENSFHFFVQGYALKLLFLVLLAAIVSRGDTD